MRTFLLYKSELLIELRSAGLAVRLTYGPVLLLLCGFAISGRVISPLALAVVYWVIIASSAMLVPLHLFSREIEEQTFHFTGQFYRPAEIFLAKLLFSLTMSAASATLCSVLFTVFVAESSFWQLLAVTLCAIMPLSVIFLLPALLSSLLRGGYALAALLGLPFLFPVFAIAVDESAGILGGKTFDPGRLIFFAAISVFISIVSTLLADPVWRSYENS